MFVWDIEWATDGVLVEQWQHHSRTVVEQQAQRWLDAQPRSQVRLYRRRGHVSVLIKIFTTDRRPRGEQDT